MLEYETFYFFFFLLSFTQAGSAYLKRYLRNSLTNPIQWMKCTHWKQIADVGGIKQLICFLK